MNQKYKSKKKCQHLHLKRRMRERFNINLTKESYDRLKSMIGSGRAKFIEAESTRLTHFLIDNFEGKSFEIVWDKKRNQIVTTFPHGGTNGSQEKRT